MSVTLTVDTDAETIGSTLADYPEDVAHVLGAIADACDGADKIVSLGAEVAARLDDKGTALIRAIAAKLGG